MVFHLLEYSEQTDDQVCAVYQETDAHDAYQGQLVIADAVTDASFEGGQSIGWSRQLVIP